MATILAFDWGNFDNRHITEDEDPAYAGDKEPNSKDDKECGDHFIPRWKDCHDGDAHRPEPGENPYWTDENSSEERKERGVPWDTNKPKSQEERDKETDWQEQVEPEPEQEDDYEDPEEEEYYQQQEEDRDILEDAIDAVPEGQWARQKDGLYKGLIAISTMWGNTNSTENMTKAFEVLKAVDDLKTEDRHDTFKSAQALQNAVAEAEEFLSGSGRSVLPNPEFYDLEVKKAQFSLDMLHKSVEKDDPRDVQVWDKIRNRPETLEVEDLLQISKLRGIDSDSMTPEEEKYAQKQITGLRSLLEKWRESPLVGGEYLAAQFMAKPERLGWSKDDMIRESPFETNPKLALAILDRSARIGDHPSNKAMWENFGLSEEWHPTSFLFDHQKAATKATKEMAQMADWSQVDAVDREMMLIGVDVAEAEEALAIQANITGNAMDALIDKRDKEGISVKEYKETLRKIEKEHQPIEEAFWGARKRLKAAENRLIEHADEVRKQVKESLKKLNVNTQIDADISGNILVKIGDAKWSELDEEDDEYKAKKGHGPGGLSGRRLYTLRRRNREMRADYPNSKKIVEHMQDFFSICHKDLLGAPELQDITWESEIFERAYAHKTKNTICLNVHPKKMPKSKEYQRAVDSRDTAADRPDIAIHEFAHHLEYRNPDIANRIADFYERRTKGQPTIKKGDKKPNGDLYSELSHFDNNEVFKDDHFFDIYCGKLYGDENNRKFLTTELISMGMQAFYNKAQWGMLVRTDREHLALMIASLRGY